MENNIDSNPTETTNIDKSNNPSRLQEPSQTEIQCKIVCQKGKEPHILFIAVLALITAIAAAGFGWWQADIARDTEKRQLRAYIVPDSIIFQKPIKIGNPIALQLFVNNMGQTPAYNVSQACIFRIAQSPHNYSTAEFKKDTHHGIAIIGSGKPIHFDNVSTTISDKEIGDVLSQKYKPKI